MGRLNLVLEYYHSQYYEDTNEDDLGEILNAAVDEVKNNIEEDQDDGTQTCLMKYYFQVDDDSAMCIARPKHNVVIMSCIFIHASAIPLK